MRRYEECNCRNCGGFIRETLEGLFCQSCGTKYVDSGQVEIKDPEGVGYGFEMGRHRAQEDLRRRSNNTRVSNSNNRTGASGLSGCLAVVGALAVAFIVITIIGSVISNYYINRIRSGKYMGTTQPITEGRSRTEGYSEVVEETESSPVSLSILPPYTWDSPWSGLPFWEFENEFDIFGNNYSYVLEAHYDEDEGPCSVSYRLDKQYSYLEFYTGISRSSRGEDGAGWIQITGDGTVLYERYGMTSDSETVLARLDVSGVTDLKIVMYADCNIYSGVWLIIGDPLLYR